ncbi:MAG: spore cortex biosynthesis protein YabQ [Clostridia bacterium]|nr:spore cortex biosynthesis protein YabQ [Clostridia bacterium]
MEISIKHEMIVFWGAFFCGQIIPFIFDFFRAMRKSFKCTRRQVAIQDIIFCLFSFKVFFDVCYLTNNGHLRWYIFISFILSMLIYFVAESPYAMKFWGAVFKLLIFIMKPFMKLFSFLAEKIKALLRFLKAEITRSFDSFSKKIRRFFTKNG